MNDLENETFERFAQRFSRIDAEVKDPPAFGRVPRGGAIEHRPGRRSISRLIAALVVVVAVAAVAPLIGGQPTTPPTSSLPALVVGSSVPPVATPSSAPSEVALVPLDPASPPEEPPGPCQSVTVMTDRMRTTIEQEAGQSMAVVIGTVSGVGKGQWNTPGGRRPNGTSIGPSLVMRLLRVDVETVVKGTASTVLTLSIQGGQIGCHGYWMGGYPAEVGSRYAFFLGGPSPRMNLEGVVPVLQMWSIEGDRVVTAFGDRVSLETFIERASGCDRTVLPIEQRC